MRRSWPFLLYIAVSVLHLAMIAIGADSDITKALLMPVLLVAVAMTVLWTDRIQRWTKRRVLAIAFLSVGIIASWAGDVLLGPTFLLGMGCFALAHVAYILLFLGPAQRHRLPWWALVYALWYFVLVPVLIPYLGELILPIVIYGIVLAGTAATAMGVNHIVAWGGAAFLASDTILAFRLFTPLMEGVVPGSVQSIAIMALYTLGQGLIAYGIVRPLRGYTRRSA